MAEVEGHPVAWGSRGGAHYMSLFVKLRDEARESWWPRGQVPSVEIPFPLAYIDEPAGIGDVLAPQVEERFRAMKDGLRKKQSKGGR